MKMSPLEILRLLQKKFRFSSEESKSITSTLVARKRKLVDLRVARIKVERRELLFIPRGSHNESKKSGEKSRFSRVRNDINSAEIEMGPSFCAFIRFARDMEKRRRRSNRE